MTTKFLIALSVVAGVAIAIAYLIASERTRETASLQQPLVPALAENLDKITRLRLTGAPNQSVITLQRDAHGWTIPEKGSYAADKSQVRKALLALADAKIIEEKTSNPSLYERLGVQDVSIAGAAGVRLDIEGLGEPISLMIGNYDARAGNGTYVRYVDEAQSLLASGNLTAEANAREWLNREVLDIAADQIQQVKIKHPDGATLTVVKDKRTQPNFTVLNIPENRVLQSDEVANSLGGVLFALQLDDVAPVTELSPSDKKSVAIEYRTFDGLLISANAFGHEDKRYVHFDVSFDGDEAQRFAEVAATDSAAVDKKRDEGEGSDALDAKNTNAADKTTAGGQRPPAREADTAKLGENELSARREHAKILNAQLSPWVYQISLNEYNNMTRRIDDLLKPEAEAQARNTEEGKTPGGE
jgi:hypothetical protein